MKITFIKHSCFLVETETFYLLFDYYEGSLPSIDPQKPIYFFASHSHGDHFSSQVFLLAENFAEKHFILSDDIFSARIPGRYTDNTLFTAPDKSYSYGPFSIETLESTDMGVAFLVSFDGITLYHAGDLNCWTWEGSPEPENTAMRRKYLQEMDKLKSKKLFAAFVPLDPRLEAVFDLGMQYFLERADVQYVFPMHMWNDFSAVTAFKNKHPAYSSKIADIYEDGQSFTIS